VSAELTGARMTVDRREGGAGGKMALQKKKKTPSFLGGVSDPLCLSSTETSPFRNCIKIEFKK
jgi:hypothetical protein